ncbi:Antibiotic biosynthesis monooxygenase, partial [Globisporangium splendens]
MPTTKPIRVLSERIMSRGFEPTVGRLMENVQKVVRRQPGLISLETLSDVNDHHKYVVLSEWRSKQDYDNWLNSKEFKECTAKIEEVLDVPGKRTTIFKQPNEDIFLL